MYLLVHTIFFSRKSDRSASGVQTHLPESGGDNDDIIRLAFQAKGAAQGAAYFMTTVVCWVDGDVYLKFELLVGSDLFSRWYIYIYYCPLYPLLLPCLTWTLSNCSLLMRKDINWPTWPSNQIKALTLLGKKRSLAEKSEKKHFLLVCLHLKQLLPYFSLHVFPSWKYTVHHGSSTLQLASSIFSPLPSSLRYFIIAVHTSIMKLCLPWASPVTCKHVKHFVWKVAFFLKFIKINCLTTEYKQKSVW